MRSGLSILNGAGLISKSIEKNNIAPNETQRIRPSFAKLLELVRTGAGQRLPAPGWRGPVSTNMSACLRKPKSPSPGPSSMSSRHEAAFLTSWRRSIGSRAAAKTHWKQSNHSDYSKHTYLLWSDTEFSFCVANAHPRPSSLGMTRPNRAAVIVNAKR
jgi:hypothetical protein